MIRRPPRSTRTDTLFPYTTLFRSGLFLLLQVGRFWVLRTLGTRWTTRVIVLPGEPLVTGGPFRFVRHPNYVIVAAEIAVLPLAFGLWKVALVFSLVNAAILTIRIRTEKIGRASCRQRVRQYV